MKTEQRLFEKIDEVHLISTHLSPDQVPDFKICLQGQEASAKMKTFNRNKQSDLINKQKNLLNGILAKLV